MKARMIWTNNRRKVRLEVYNRYPSNSFYEDCDVRIASISRIACLAWNITGEFRLVVHLATRWRQSASWPD